MSTAWIHFAPGFGPEEARDLAPDDLFARASGEHELVVPRPPFGELRLFVFDRPGLGPGLRERLTAPRSGSTAERWWNLLCRARAAGVGVADPVAVGASDRGAFARRSFLLVREPHSVISADDWAARALPEDARARGRDAIRAALDALARAGVWLPELGARDLLLADERAFGADDPPETGDCGPSSALPPGLKRNRLPGVIVLRFGGGALLRSVDLRRRARLRARIERELESASGARAT